MIVVKLGGNAIEGAGAAAICGDVAALTASGAQVVIVHGGGPQATALQAKLGLATKQVAGRRVTDEATLDVMKMVVGGKLNVDLCAALLRAGARPVGLHGASACAIEARRRPPSIIRGSPPEPVDLGLVGDVVAVSHALIGLLLGAGYVPVLACLGASAAGQSSVGRWFGRLATWRTPIPAESSRARGWIQASTASGSFPARAASGSRARSASV